MHDKGKSDKVTFDKDKGTFEKDKDIGYKR